MGKKLRREFDKTMGYVDEICDILETPDEYRALLALKALIKRQKTLEAYIDEITSLLEVDNIGNAMSRIKTRLMGRVVSETLPQELREIPEVWMNGRPDTKVRKGFAPLTLFQAERQHRRLLAYIEDAWALTFERDSEQGEALREDLLNEYRTSSPEEMAQACYAYCKDYEIEPAYNVLPAEKPQTANDGEIRAILENMKPDYGVVSKE